MVGVNMTPCNWGVLFAPNAGVSLEFDKESDPLHSRYKSFAQTVDILID